MRKRKVKTITCKECGEIKPHASKGLCRSCYHRLFVKKPYKTCKWCKQLYPNTFEYFPAIDVSTKSIIKKKGTSRICLNCSTSSLRKCTECNEMLSVTEFYGNYDCKCKKCKLKILKLRIKSNDPLYIKSLQNQRKYRKKTVDNITDSYIKRIFSITKPNTEITQKDIVLKRAEIAAKRKYTDGYIKRMFQTNIRNNFDEKVSSNNIPKKLVTMYKRLLIIDKKAEALILFNNH